MSEYTTLNKLPALQQARDFMLEVKDKYVLPMREELLKVRAELEKELAKAEARRAGLEDPAERPEQAVSAMNEEPSGKGSGPAGRQL